MKRLFQIGIILISHNVLAQGGGKRINHIIEPSLNYSFIEDKNINSASFNGPVSDEFDFTGANLNFGFGLKWLMSIKLNEKNTFNFGLSYYSSSYRFTFDSSLISKVNRGLSIPIFITHTFNAKFSAGIGTEIMYSAFEGENNNYLYHDSLSYLLDKPSGLISDQTYEQILVPLVMYGEYSLYTKKGRRQSFVLYFRKSFQIVEGTTLTMYNENGQETSVSTFNFKHSNLAVAYRFYLKEKIKK